MSYDSDLARFPNVPWENPLEQLARARERRHAVPNLTAEEVGRIDDAGELVTEVWRSVGGRSG